MIGDVVKVILKMYCGITERENNHFDTGMCWEACQDIITNITNLPTLNPY